MIVTAFVAKDAKALAPGAYLAFKEHPGLRLVVGQTRRSWIYRYAHPETGQQRQIRLGLWPALGFGQAVDAWDQARQQRDKGVDVGAAVRGAKREKKAAVVAAAKRVERTCNWLIGRYLDEMVTPNRKPKGAAECRRMLERAFAEHGDTPAEELTIEQAHGIILKVAATAPRVAMMTRSEARAAWEHGTSAGLIKTPNPFAGKSVGGKLRAQKRERHLSDAEAGKLLAWMAEPGAYSRTVRDALELTLRTGLRSGEVCGIHTRELERRGGVLWLDIPASRMKAGKPHSVPLVGTALAVVTARMPEDGGYLFPSKRGEKPIDQKVLGVEVYSCAGRSTSPVYKHRRVCPVSEWAPHDLRRTARTLLQSLGCPFEVGEAILSHALPGVAGVYGRHDFATQKIEWLTKLGRRLDELAATAAAGKGAP